MKAAPPAPSGDVFWYGGAPPAAGRPLHRALALAHGLVAARSL